MKVSANKDEMTKIEREIKDKKNKTCLYPDCDSKDIIKSHSIQNKILKSISNDGMLVSHVRTVEQSYGVQGLGPKMIEIGRKNASTFKGFCKKHDSELFSPIGDNDYKNNSLQNFLFTYRACAYDYTRAQEFAHITDKVTGIGIKEKEIGLEKVKELILEIQSLFPNKKQENKTKNSQSNFLEDKQSKRENNPMENPVNNHLEQIKDKVINEVDNKEIEKNEWNLKNLAINVSKSIVGKNI